MKRDKGADAVSAKKRAVVRVGDVIGGHYLIEEALDEGGMAVVFRATNTATGKPCALKILHAQLGDRPEFVQLFAKEAKVSSVVGDNDHIVTVFDAGLDEALGIPFIVMELLAGETLELVLARGPLSPELAKTLLAQLSDALEQAHQAGVVHRDLKPSNLFITTDRDGDPWLKVMDFGIAKVLEGEAVRTATHVGTPAYNAPEQMGSTTRKLAARQGITIASGVSPATDVWAIGLLSYEMFTGDVSGRYWGVETLSELPMKVAFEELVAPSVRAGDDAALLPLGFDDWFVRCLAKNAPERYQTAGAAIDALFALIEGDVIDLDALDAAKTRLKNSPVQGADKAKTRVKTNKKKVSEPPPLPRISSPAITVAKGPVGLSNKREAVSSAPPVVTGDRRAAQATQSRWGMMIGVGLLALGAVGAIAYSQHKKQAASVDACEGSAASPQACQEACDSGKIHSCHVLAGMVQRGHGAEQDSAKALGLYGKACGVDGFEASAVATWAKGVEAAGCADETCVAEACVALAGAYEAGKDGADKNARAATALYKRTCRVDMDEQPRGSHGCVGLGEQRAGAGQMEAARNYYAAACEDDLPRGCVRLGTVLERGDEDWRDEKRARQLYDKACEAGDLEGCTRLGTMVERGLGGWVKDEEKAVELYDRACDGGQMLGCLQLADAFLGGKGKLTRDAVRAVELFQRGCDGGEMRACARLADANLRGTGGLTQNEKYAFSLNQRACEGGALIGCAQLGAMYLNGAAGLTKDAKEGRSLVERACQGNEPLGCVMLGRLDAVGGTASREDLIATFDKACSGGVTDGCIELAALFEASNDIDEQKRAVDLYDAACDAEHARACTNLANLVYSGAGGIERDAARSVALNTKACDGGDAVGCARLGLLYALGQGVETDVERAKLLHTRACGGVLDESMQQRCDALQKRLAPPEAD